MQNNDHRIRERAYALWEEEGRPEGREHDHWSRAAAEIAERLGRENPGEHGSGDNPATAGSSGSPGGSGNGLSMGLQSGGTIPGGGPGAGVGSIGTGGGSTANQSTGSSH
jgi:hypothetical protein